MQSAREILDRQYLEMRNRVLSLAADFDRLQRAAGGEQVLQGDARVAALRQCLQDVLSNDVDRAERVQMHLSDRTPAPGR